MHQKPGWQIWGRGTSFTSVTVMLVAFACGGALMTTGTPSAAERSVALIEATLARRAAADIGASS